MSLVQTHELLLAHIVMLSAVNIIVMLTTCPYVCLHACLVLLMLKSTRRGAALTRPAHVSSRLHEGRYIIVLCDVLSLIQVSRCFTPS